MTSTTTAYPFNDAGLTTFSVPNAGVTDAVSAIQSAINAASGGGSILLPPGTYLISAPLSLGVANFHLHGVGPGTVLKAASGFSGAGMVAITADMCEVRDLRIIGGPNTSSAANPVTNAIEVTGARYARLENLHLSYVNGYGIEIVGTASVNCVGAVLRAIHCEHCAQGIHLLGNSGSNNVGQMFLSAIHPEVVDNGDALLLEDINDIEVENFNGAVAGRSSAVRFISKATVPRAFLITLTLAPLLLAPSVRQSLLRAESMVRQPTSVLRMALCKKGSRWLVSLVAPISLFTVSASRRTRAMA